MKSAMESAADSAGLSILNSSPRTVEGPDLLHDLVATSSRDGLTAIDCRMENGGLIGITYHELHSAASALAARISEALRSVPPVNPPESLVIPILLPQSPALYVGLLAILKVGAAFCPLSTDAPVERLKFIVRDVGAKIVLIDSRLLARLPGDDAYIILPVNHRMGGPKCDIIRSAPYRVPKASDLAYVMYTSGSTGTPKGVGVSHLAATQSLLAHDRHIPSFNRFLQFAAPTFDVSVFEIFFPLFRGSTLVCCSRADMLSDLPGVLRDMRVDACELTPSVAGSLLRKRHNAPGLRLLLTIGEMLTEPVIREFGGDEEERSLLWGMYGPTEATIHCTLQPASSKNSSKNNIGIPLDTVSVFVIASDTPEFRVLPLGQTGELAIGGSQVATGYVNRPEQTSAAFVDTLWGRVYRTGDKARILPDGTIECLGRIAGGQVKLNGQRMELGEVESALLRTPGCHGAFAAVISNVLVAFAAVEDTTESAGIRAAILSQCKSWLPAFMLPADIKIMEHFPRLPSGKVDKNTLVEKYGTTTSRGLDCEDDFGDGIERQLCDIAGAVLGRRVTPSTQLSPLGLDSLTAIEYASMIRAIGVSISPIDILDAPTIRELARIIEKRRNAPCLPHAAEAPLDQDRSSPSRDLIKSDNTMRLYIEDVERIEMCSPLQEAMVAETLKDARLYVNQTELHLPGHLTTESIESWFFALARRNETLRTGFAYIGNNLYQVIWKMLDKAQIEILSHAHSFEQVDVEHFLRRPLKVEIIRGQSLSEHRSVILTLHHSVYDGWTMDLIVEDLSRLARGEPLIDRPQFRLVCQHLASTPEIELMDSKEFWAEKLRGSAPSLLPNFKTVAVPESQIVTMRKEMRMSPRLVADFAVGASVGRQVIFQACIAWLWGAISGVDDTIIGSVSSGRALPTPGIENIMGPCTTTVPLRIMLSRYVSIIELIQGIHLYNREALRHDSLPLAEIKRIAGLPPGQRLFDIIFAYQETLTSRRRNSDTIYEAWHKDAVEAKLLVEVSPSEDHFSCQLTWHSDSFSHIQIDTLFQHLDCLINHFIANTDRPLSSILECFPVGNLSRYGEYPKSLDILPSLSVLVERTASEYPTRDALCFASSISTSRADTHTLTYRELNSEANRIADYLRRSGVTTGGVVALVLEKSPLLYCAILGILKSGCAYLPILPSTPPQRIQLILKQAQPRICLTSEHFPRQVAEAASCPIIDFARVKLSSYSDCAPSITGDRSNLAYVIYTSGTTGVPKGVSVTNANVLSNIEALSRVYPHEPSDRMLQACSQAFDVSVFEIFFSWGNGMCLCSATNDTLFEDLGRAVQALGITHLSMTVTVASLIEPDQVPNVKLLVTSGEPMTNEVQEKWAQQLWQGYGPSETTNICTVRKVSRGDSPQYLGWPLENTSVFLFSPRTTQLVPLGCVGELCFGGDQVAAGYLEMPEQTASKFFNHREYGRLYRSGDLGRMLPDGSLIILGRIDTQVKLRGLRIELQEIQAAVLRSGFAKACTSVPISLRGARTQQLALFYVPTGQEHSRFSILPITDSARQTIIIVREELRAALPDYMVPSFILPISALPLTPSGKVNHDLLHHSINGLSDEIINSCSSIQDLDQGPFEWTESEILISEAISETLCLDKKVISRWSSFAALGIDSITAMPLARRLQTVFGTRIPLSLVLSNPSVGRLASAVAKARSSCSTRAEGASEILPKPLVEAVRSRFESGEAKHVDRILPCTPLQEAMLSSSPSSARRPSYSNQMLFRLYLPSEGMKRHWNMMFERHGILRTCFVTTEDRQYPMVQVLLKSHSPAWETIKTDSASFQEHVSRHAMSLPAALDSGEPPVSLAIILLENSIEYLSFVCHHAIYDGVSAKCLLAEIESVSRHEELPAPVPFEEFLREALPLPPGSDVFWEEHFRSFSPLTFNKLTSVGGSDTGVVFGNACSRPLVSITTQLRDLGISLLSLCQTAWAITLSLLQGEDDVCFGNVVNGRSIALDRVDTLVAPCFNTIPIRMNISSAKLLHQVMKQFQQLNIDMIPYQFTSLRRIQSQLGLSRLFDTVLILQPQAEPFDKNIWSLEQECGAMDVPLVCEITPFRDQNTLTLTLHRDSSIFSHETSLLILDIFRSVVDACLEHPSSHVVTTSNLPTQWKSQISGLSLSPVIQQTNIAGGVSRGPMVRETWSEPERIVRSALSKLAKIPEETIEREKSIYRYGLDSIGAVQLATLLRRKSYAISAVDVIENPTCAGIGSLLTTQDRKEDRFIYDFGGFENIVKQWLGSGLAKHYEALLPCTPAQQGMISQFLNSNGRLYFNYTTWVLQSGVDPGRIVRAWSHVAAHCQILRTGFVPIDHKDSSYAMVVYPTEGFSVPVSVRRPSSFDNSKWRIEASSKALETLSVPPWQVVIVNGVSHEPIMHLAMHHALYDARSLRKLLILLAESLSGVMSWELSPIQPVLSTYFNTAHDQPTSEKFWREKAEDFVATKFPTMTPLHVTDHTTLTTSLTCEMVPDDLRRGVQNAGITARAAIQAAWVRVLSAYLGESSVTFGIVLDGRNTQEEQRVIFPMVTTLPIIARNSSSNSELLEHMMQYNTSLRRHERTPLSKVQRWLGRPDGQLFDTIIAYRTMDETGNDFPWRLLEEAPSVEYAIALEVVETASNSLQLDLIHRSDILPVEQARLLLLQFDALLAHLISSPRGHADQLPHLVPKLFSVLPASYERLPPPADLLHQLVERTSRRTPMATALEFVEGLGDPILRRCWTYCELDEMGNRVANMLLHHGIVPRSIVATCFNKCPEAYFSILGILKAGCAFLSLDTNAPASRLNFILRDSAASCLLIEPNLVDIINLDTSTPIYVVKERELLGFPTSYQKSPQASPSDTCYCLYTSGTTGTPKGCLISHENAVQAMLAFENLFAGHWDGYSRWLQFASFHFDVSVLEQYWSWFVGIVVVAAPKDLVLADITATISSLEITHIDLTPSLARLIHPDEVPSLCKGVFITGGEKLRQEILQAWGPKKVIYNAYGPTEATIGVTMYRRVPANGRSSNIGFQFPNVGSYVFEPGTELPVLKGGIGELCVSGRLVGQGYLNRKGLTEERFPILRRYGERVYRTGDLVRVLHDTSFDFLGRADDQVKLRGQRLEIGEINHAIKTSLRSQLADVVTFVTRLPGQDRDLLVSFLAPIANTTQPKDLQIYTDKHSLDMSQASLKACRDRLPTYMVPTYVLCVPFIPLSANNKEDIKRLKDLFAETPIDKIRDGMIGAARTHRALSKKEQLVALAISKITQVAETEMLPTSSIFELGIDSINVARLALVLQSQGFGLANPSLILRHPRLSYLSQALSRASPTPSGRQTLQVKQSIRAHYHRHIGAVCTALGVDKADVEYIAPCTPLQEGMITRSKTTEAWTAYFNQFEINLDSQTSVSRLKTCWDNVFTECAILRTAFLATADGLIQVAIKKKSIPWFETDPEGRDIKLFMSERRERWIASNQDTLRYPVEIDHFDHEGTHTLLLRLFHAVYDGRSLELLLQRVNSEYLHERPVPSPTFFEILPHGPLLKHVQSRPFWEEVFKDRAFRPIPPLTNEAGVTDIFLSRVFHVNGLEARRLALGVTHQTVVQCAWLVTLWQRFGFVPNIGVVFSGRSLVFKNIENVIGPVFNTLPFRVDFTKYDSWTLLAHRVQEYNTSVLEYVHTPLRDIQKWCSKGQSLFDVLLTFDRNNRIPAMGEKPFWSSVHSIGTSDYPLSLEVILSEDQSLLVNVAARRDIATGATTSLLLDEFSKVLAAFANSDGDTPLLRPPTETVGLATVPEGLFTSDPGPSDADALGVGLFESDIARDVRHEVASVAGLPDEDILETTTFFELGLDSIDGIRLASRLNRLGIQITLSHLMKNPTIQNILRSYSGIDTNGNGYYDSAARLMDSSASLKSYLIQNGEDLKNVTAILPPTPLQDSMVADMLLSGFRRYFNHDVLEISRNTDIDRLKIAWATVYAGSPILRTTFVEIDSPSSRAAFCQIVRGESLEFKPTVELSSLEQISTVFSQARDRAVMANGTSDLFQLVLVITPANRYLVLSIAHALYDGWSLGLLHEDVQAAYEDRYHERKEYEPYLSQLLFGPAATDGSFWAGYLNDARPTILHPATDLPKYKQPIIYRSELVSTVDLGGLKALCQRYRITPQVLAQGCWASVLASMSKSLDVIFGVVLSGRTADEAQALLFPTMNTVPLRVVLHGTIAEYFDYLQATMSDIIGSQHVPLREIRKLANLTGDGLFNTLFLLQNAKEHGARPQNPILRSIHGSSAVEYPVCVEMEITENSIVWRMAGDERYVSMEGVDEILANIEAVLVYFTGDHANVLEFDDELGKVSVCGLESFELSFNSDNDVRTAPRNASSWEVSVAELDSPLLDVLSELSGIDKYAINPSHSIYHLGLDSISAIKASSMLRRRGLDVSVRALLKATSIREFLNRSSGSTKQPRNFPSATQSPLNLVLDQAEMDSLFKKIGVNPADVENVLPALPMQVHMLSVWNNSGGLLFFPRFTYKFGGETNYETVVKAWSLLTAETPMLRTQFVATRSTEIPFIQIITKPKPTDFSGRIATDIGKRQHTYEETVTPFVFVRIQNLHPQDTRVHLHIHHALYDAISLSTIISRFVQLCANILEPTPAPCPFQWYSFISNHYSPEVRLQRQRFWTSYLRDADPVRLLASHEPPANGQIIQPLAQLRHGAVNSASKLKMTSSAHGTTLQALFFAAYSRALASSQHSGESSGQDKDVVIGIYIANRTNIDGLEEAPFPTLSIVPLLVKKPLARPVLSLAVEIQADLLEIGSFDNVSVGLWEIFNWTGIRIESSVNFLLTPINPTATGTSRKVTMTKVTDETTSSPNKNDPLPGVARQDIDFAWQSELMKAFVHTVDVEVAIREDAMDIGLFGPPSFPESQAEVLIDSTITILNAVC